MAKVERGILKLSGELFGNEEEHISFDRYDDVAKQLIEIQKQTKIQLAMVVGGGNSGFDESLYLLSLGVAEIILVEALDRCCASEITQAKLRSYSNVEIRNSTLVAATVNEGNGCQVMLENLRNGTRTSLYVDGIFVFIGQKANTDLFRGLVDLDAHHYIITGPNRETNVLGVYAAGDVVQKSYRYLTTAMADGTIAALAAEKYIRDRVGSEMRPTEAAAGSNEPLTSNW